jgi:hypothetical protein
MVSWTEELRDGIEINDGMEGEETQKDDAD